MIDQDFIELTAKKFLKEYPYNLNEVNEFANLVAVYAENKLYDEFIKMLHEIDKLITDEKSSKVLRAIIEALIVNRR